MSSCVCVGKADHCALCKRIRHSRAPVRLKNKSVAARGNIVKVRVQNTLNRPALFFRLPLFLSGKFLDEPGDHPVAAVDLKFRIIHIVRNGRIGRQELLRFKVVLYHHLNGCGGAERNGGLVILENGKTERFAALV